MAHADRDETHEPDVPRFERRAPGARAPLTEILAQVSSEALQGETLDEVLQRIVDCLTRQLPVAIASIVLLNERGTHFLQEVWSGDLDFLQIDGASWPITQGVTGRCARTGAAQLIVDVDLDPDYVPGNSEVKSEYLVPIRHRERLHGVLNLESTRADFFTHEVCAMFDAVASQVAGAIHLARVVHELERANRRLQELSMSDGLTGIANRRCFDLRIEDEWHRHASDGRSLALLLIDVDWFKPLNDACGHLYGDECLRALARVCADTAEVADALVARFGGEEFVLLLPGCDRRAARRIGERLRRRVESLAMAHPKSSVAPHVTISIGVSALCPDAAQSSDVLIAASDRALYTAKAKGRNRVVARALSHDASNR